MARDKELVKASKFLSLVLRHRPEVIGLDIDEHGWAQVDELIEGANRSGRRLNRELIEKVVARSDKQRYSLSPDGERIRANYGHSIPVDLKLEPVAPPERLFHGTAQRFLDSIKDRGLSPGKRLYVHLSPDRGAAIQVGQRHGRPVVLEVKAGAMQRDGYRFFKSGRGTWLTRRVPPVYLEFPRD
jgi:putative RNA 2'-phosphotransferase